MFNLNNYNEQCYFLLINYYFKLARPAENIAVVLNHSP